MVDKTTNTKLGIIHLYRSDYSVVYYTREMAKLIKKSHVTLLPHLKALKTDNILLAKTVGKNKVYSLNLGNIAAKSYLLVSEAMETISCIEEIFIIKKIISEIFNINTTGTITLFGSYAKKTFKEDSDIDIFYIGEISNKEIQEMRKIGKTYGKIINIKHSTLTNFESGLRKKDPLITEIIKNHVILQNPDIFISALWRYYNEIRRE